MFKSPIKLINIYIVFTVLFSMFGPLKYYDYQKILVLIFMILIIAMLNLGYYCSLKYNVKIRSGNTQYSTEDKYEAIRRLFKVFLNISFFTSAYILLELMLLHPQRFSVLRLGESYMESYNQVQNSGYTIGTLLRFSCSFFYIATIIWGLYYFKKLSRKEKLLFIAFIVMTAAIYLFGYGVQSKLGHMVIYALAIYILTIKKSTKKISKKLKRRVIVVVALMLVVFTVIQAQRAEANGNTVQNYAQRSPGKYYDQDHIFFKVFGTGNLGFGAASILSAYLSDGYYGLSLCLRLPFQWTYGIGSSFTASSAINILTHYDAYSSTYLGRLESVYNRNGLRSWNTIFPWLASDLTWLGTVVLFFLVGYFLGFVWKESMKYKNPASILVFATLMLGLFFIPANNQLFHGIDSYISTVCILVYWAYSHRKYNTYKSQHKIEFDAENTASKK